MWRGLVLIFWLMGTPSFGQDASLIYTDNDAKALKIAMLAKADKEVRSFFASRFDLSIHTPVALIATSDPAQLNTHLSKGLKDLGRRPRSSPINVVKLCDNKPIGAAANRPYIVMCWPKPADYDARWLASISKRLTPVLAHEFAHQLQYHLAQDDPVKRIAGTKEILLGPSWMIEGSAEVFEHLFEVSTQKENSDTDAQSLFNMQSPARRSRLTLSQITKTGSTRGRGAYGTARFAAFLLAQRSGPEALFQYFETLGKVNDRDIAFKEVFGLSFEEFEADFERVRRDFAAAQEYVRIRQ
jgi:hypothetical protein